MKSNNYIIINFGNILESRLDSDIVSCETLTDVTNVTSRYEYS